MIYCIVVMMCGVAFFSYIMGTLFDIMTTYREKTGPPDLNEDLHQWLLKLQRFNPRLPSVIKDEIRKDMKYHWAYDRMMLMRTYGSYEVNQLPYSIRRDVVINHLYKDVIIANKRIFQVTPSY